LNHDFGIPLAGGTPNAFLRERASATPLAPAEERPRAPHARAAGTPVAPPITTSLRALQEWFAAAVMHPVSVASSVAERPHIGDEALRVEDVERVVLPSDQLSGLERLEIYHRAYRARLVECLADDYPVLQRALGEDRFEALCHAYIAEHPSASPNLNFFGRHLSDFCRTWQDSLSTFASNLAALEWAIVEVLHAAAARSLSLEALLDVPTEQWAAARFVASPTVRLFQFAYPVNTYFQACINGSNPSVPPRGESATAVFRDGPTIWRMDLNRPMQALLASLFAGVSLGDALDRLVAAGEMTEDQAPELIGWFRDWVGHGFFASVDLSRASI